MFRAFGVVIRAFGAVIRAFGALIRAFGVVIRAFGAVIRAFGVVIRAFGVVFSASFFDGHAFSFYPLGMAPGQHPSGVGTDGRAAVPGAWAGGTDDRIVVSKAPGMR